MILQRRPLFFIFRFQGDGGCFMFEYNHIYCYLIVLSNGWVNTLKDQSKATINHVQFFFFFSPIRFSFGLLWVCQAYNNGHNRSFCWVRRVFHWRMIEHRCSIKLIFSRGWRTQQALQNKQFSSFFLWTHKRPKYDRTEHKTGQELCRNH